MSETIPIEPLTPRQLETLRLLADDLKTPEVADRMGIRIPTVERHVGDILAKLHVRTRAGAVYRAMCIGLIQ